MATICLPTFAPGSYLVLATRKGIVKRTPLSAFQNPRAGGIIAMGVEDDDAVIAVLTTDGIYLVQLIEKKREKTETRYNLREPAREMLSVDLDLLAVPEQRALHPQRQVMDVLGHHRRLASGGPSRR